MGAPSALHEDRRTLLVDMAVLAGYTVEVDAWATIIPDVVRIHKSHPALLIGDAKATESPTCLETRGRLMSYLAVAKEWLRAGFKVDAVVVHGPVVGMGWLGLLNEVTGSVGLVSPGGWCVRITDSDWVSRVIVELPPGKDRASQSGDRPQ